MFAVEEEDQGVQGGERHLGPTVREGEYVFGVAHIFASFNDTFIVSAVYVVKFYRTWKK